MACEKLETRLHNFSIRYAAKEQRNCLYISQESSRFLLIEFVSKNTYLA